MCNNLSSIISRLISLQVTNNEHNYPTSLHLLAITSFYLFSKSIIFIPTGSRTHKVFKKTAMQLDLSVTSVHF